MLQNGQAVAGIDLYWIVPRILKDRLVFFQLTCKMGQGSAFEDCA